VPDARARSGHRERPTGPDSDHTVVWFDEIAGTGKQVSRATVGYDEHRLEATQGSIDAPVSCQFNGSPFEVATMLFELRLEPTEQRETISRRSGKPGQNAILVETTHLLRLMFDNRLPERHLAVTGQDDNVAVSDGQYGGCVESSHEGEKGTGRTSNPAS
jgi:hypothetical protein